MIVVYAEDRTKGWYCFPMVGLSYLLGTFADALSEHHGPSACVWIIPGTMTE